MREKGPGYSKPSNKKPEEFPDENKDPDLSGQRVREVTLGKS